MSEAPTNAPGLSADQADEIRRRVGPNRIPEPPRPGVPARVLEQLRDPMIVLLVVAAVVAGSLRDWSSTVIIAMVVVFNTAAGVVQQLRAERAMAALRQLVSPRAEVRRDGEGHGGPRRAHRHGRVRGAERRGVVVGGDVRADPIGARGGWRTGWPAQGPARR